MCHICRIVLALLAMAGGIARAAHTKSNNIAAAATTASTTTINTTTGVTANQHSTHAAANRHSSNSSSSSSSGRDRDSAACYYWKLSLVDKHYSVHALAVPDEAIATVCAGLEARRYERGDYEIFGVKPLCQRHPKGGLDWQMEPSAGCSPADVGEIWHDVTRDQYGSVQCVVAPYAALD